MLLWHEEVLHWLHLRPLTFNGERLMVNGKTGGLCEKLTTLSVHGSQLECGHMEDAFFSIIHTLHWNQRHHPTVLGYAWHLVETTLTLGCHLLKLGSCLALRLPLTLLRPLIRENRKIALHLVVQAKFVLCFGVAGGFGRHLQLHLALVLRDRCAFPEPLVLNGLDLCDVD